MKRSQYERCKCIRALTQHNLYSTYVCMYVTHVLHSLLTGLYKFAIHITRISYVYTPYTVVVVVRYCTIYMYLSSLRLRE